MKKLLQTVVVVSSFLVAGQLSAAETKFAIVDARKITEESLAFKSARDQVNKKAETLRTKATEKEKKLKQRFQELESQKAALSKEALDEKSKKLMQEAEEFNKSSYAERMGIEKAFADSMGKIEKAVSEIIKAKAQSDKINIVIDKSMVFYSAGSLEITDYVLSELNKKLSFAQRTGNAQLANQIRMAIETFRNKYQEKMQAIHDNQNKNNPDFSDRIDISWM